MKNFTVIGSGLVGSLLSIYLAKRGYNVTVYERRPDLRKNRISAGRSINLALSDRGWRGLAGVGIVDEIKKSDIEITDFNKGNISSKQIIFGISSSDNPLSKNFKNLKKINLINNSYFYLKNFIRKLPESIKVIIIHNRHNSFCIDNRSCHL